MADKEQDKPEHHTTGAKFKRAATAAADTTGDFFSNWGQNIGLRQGHSFVWGLFQTNLNLIIPLSLVTALGTTAVLDKDITADQNIPKDQTPLHMNLTGDTSDGYSIIERDGMYFSLVKHDENFQLYTVSPHGDEATWSLVQDEGIAARVINDVQVELRQGLDAQQDNPTHVGEYPQAMRVSGELSVPYNVESSVPVRFGNIENQPLLFGQEHGYYTRTQAMWEDAAQSVEQGNYGLNSDVLETYSEEDFDFFDQYISRYNAGIGLFWLALIGGSGALALGQTGANIVGRRKKPAPQAKDKDQKSPKLKAPKPITK